MYAGDLVGALGLAVLIHPSGILDLANGAVGETVRIIGIAKVAIGAGEAFVRGILCSVLVCLAVWMCFAARTVAGKVFAIMFPISGFVAIGFEHSVANMLFIPIAAWQPGSEIEALDLLQNLLPVTLGNIIGGGGFVAAICWPDHVRQA